MELVLREPLFELLRNHIAHPIGSNRASYLYNKRHDTADA